MDFKNQSPSSSFKSKLSRSTVFDATIEQAKISMQKQRPRREILNMYREPTNLRSSSTYSSSLFEPLSFVAKPQHFNKPKDNLSTDYFGTDHNEYYRKSIVSEFKPDFQPRYTRQSAWAVNNETFRPVTPPKETKARWIKPISKKIIQQIKTTTDSTDNSIKLSKLDTYNFSYFSRNQKSTRATSKKSSRLPSRAETPQPKDLFVNLNCESFENYTLYTEETETSNHLLETKNFLREIPKRHGSIRPKSRLGSNELLLSNREYTMKTEGNENVEKHNEEWRDLTKTQVDSTKNVNYYKLILEAWKENRTIGTSNSTRTPNYMRKTISSMSKSKVL